LEGHAWVIVAAADAAIRDTQLPHDIAQPLLVDAQLGGLGLSAVEVGGQSVGELLLQGREVCGRAVVACLVPQGDKLVVEWLEEGHEVDEASEWRRVFGWVVGCGGKLDGRWESEWAVALECV
jgi:hypothetical protein